FEATADYDLRVSAISPASQQLLEDLGAWDIIVQQRICPYSQMRVWEADQNTELHFSAVDAGITQLGHIIENSLIIHALWQCLDKVEVFCPASLRGLEIGAETARLTLDDGRQLCAALVIAADGGQSQTRQLADIGVYGRGYQQRGIVAVVKTRHSHEETAWQRFLPNGPVAFLPLANGCSSIVWSADDAWADELLALDEAGFAERLAQAVQHRLGEVEILSRRAAFPLRIQQAEQYCAPRLALVGDAAHVVHPLAGQGVNLGFGDVACLCKLVTETRDKGRDLGEHRRLRRYERARKAEDMLMAQLTDGLSRLYGSEHGLLKLGRREGIRAVNQVLPLKTALMRHAMGK
ncbi:MAG: UbiH/UbiF/VisC/COQ6 family ubiquinone biosynthesis hydroxylase, partial [Nevskiales bacterium]